MEEITKVAEIVEAVGEITSLVMEAAIIEGQVLSIKCDWKFRLPN